MGRTRTLLGLLLITIGVISLSRVFTQPQLPPVPALPPMPAMPEMPAMPPMPALPEMPAMPELPPLPPMPEMPAPPPAHHSGWLNPPVLLLAVLLAAIWLRRRGPRERPIA